jgi:NADH-quinone oxidoreductase subunit A
MTGTVTAARLRELGLPDVSSTQASTPELQKAASDLALMSFADIATFFLVLMVGFAYVWKRGDLDWVRAVRRERAQPLQRPPTPRAIEPSQSILSA